LQKTAGRIMSKKLILKEMYEQLHNIRIILLKSEKQIDPDIETRLNNLLNEIAIEVKQESFEIPYK